MNISHLDVDYATNMGICTEIALKPRKLLTIILEKRSEMLRVSKK